MADKKKQAKTLLTQWKGEDYVFGLGCTDRLGELVASEGKRAAVVVSGVGKDWGEPLHQAVSETLDAAGVELAGDLIPSARPNAPRDDVFRIAERLEEYQPEVVVAVAGGSGIDATKAAAAIWTLGRDDAGLDACFGSNQVSQLLQERGKTLPPLVAGQLASGSAAHLTKYSNVTDLDRAQKMLIVDQAVVPDKAIFDYTWTKTMSPQFTMDGALDGVSHCLEVWMGAPDEKLDQLRPVALGGVDLIVNSLKAAVDRPDDLDAREALGLGTDLGGYAIMIGGTNGAHLTSFSLVDVLPHGRACALMNPYYVVFFAPAIEDRLREVGRIYAGAGYLDADLDALSGRALGEAVAEGMVNHSRDIGFPTKLTEVEGFQQGHIDRALQAAKNPQLEMKLKNMPVPLSADTVDEYMAPILEAARTGDFSQIKAM